jgi:hypothetical protein
MTMTLRWGRQYRFLTRKCRPWLPCSSSNGRQTHTHHLPLMIVPLRKVDR